MKNIIVLSIIAFVVIFCGACDKIDPPYREQHATDTSSTYKRKILVEDFTGQKCGSCPAAHRVLAYLTDTLYKGTIIPIAIHAGSMAVPDADFPINYRTTVGDQIFVDFDILYTPYGMVNRSYFNGDIVLLKESWASAIQYQLDSVVPYKISINPDCDFNTSSRIATITAETKFLENITAVLNICVYITEDSIVSKQEDYDHTPYLIPDYLHRHVLRGAAITGAYGEKLFNGSVASEQIITKTYQVYIDPAWNEKHCAAIIFIYEDQGTIQGKIHKEIQQAAEVKITE